MNNNFSELQDNTVVWLTVKTLTGKTGKIKGYKVQYQDKYSKQHVEFRYPDGGYLPHDVLGWENL